MLNLLPNARLLKALIALIVIFITLDGVRIFAHIDLSFVSLVIAGLALFLVVIDAILALWSNRRIHLSFSREMPHHFIVGQATEIALNIYHDSPQKKSSHSQKRKIHFALFDHVPSTFEFCTEFRTSSKEQGKSKETMPIEVTLEADKFSTVRYRVKPQRRGAETFTGVQVRLNSPMGLWQTNRFVEAVDEVKTYPDFRRIDNSDLQTDEAHSHGSLPHHRKRGSGTDFAELREYQVGDSLSHIDHKATSRLNKLMAKSFQIERDQQVMILLDCSRRLRVFQEDLSHFDYALNSTIFLARTILNQGDAVGLMNFGSGEVRYSKPQKGRNSVNRLLNQIYDLEPSRTAPDYIRAAEQLMVRQKRRSLIIIITCLQEEDTDAIKTMLRILQKRHLVLIANLKEELLGKAVTIRDLDDAVYYASRETYHHYRQQMIQQIGNRQLILLDTYPTSLSAQLINLYLNVKQSGRF